MSLTSGRGDTRMITVGSLCSGIEAASVAWEATGAIHVAWLSEIAPFPSLLLKERYPEKENYGDMRSLAKRIAGGEIQPVDLLAGGTPCQAFSLAGWKNGLEDERGNLTIAFVDVVEANDKARLAKGGERSLVFWENVEGVLTDKTNAFGCLISSLAGLDEVLPPRRWGNAGVLRGPKRNVAWRVLDARYFGLPQQRRRLYLLAGPTNFFPEDVLFESKQENRKAAVASGGDERRSKGVFEVFRGYSDCLYSAYGTKWNGNAAAYNGSLYVAQEGRLRRLSPLECERLMGFPDGYTELKNATRTVRYQALGNSWAVPTIRWIGDSLLNVLSSGKNVRLIDDDVDGQELFSLGQRYRYLSEEDINSLGINCSDSPNDIIESHLLDFLDSSAPESIYISPTGAFGILRRAKERNIRINPRLRDLLAKTAKLMTIEEIEERSRKQTRGAASNYSRSEIQELYISL